MKFSLTIDRPSKPITRIMYGLKDHTRKLKPHYPLPKMYNDGRHIFKECTTSLLIAQIQLLRSGDF